MKARVDWAVFIFYTVFVTFASLRPMNSASIGHWDKLGHLLLYGFFAILGYRVFRQPRAYLSVCIAIVFYSGLMEVLQSFMPSRMMSGYDLLANGLGVLLGAIIATKGFSVLKP